MEATASIIAIFQLSEKVVKYIKTATGATKDRKRLREEVRSCGNITQQLKDEVGDSEEGSAWEKTIKTLNAPDAPLCRLHIALDMVRVKLQTQDSISKALKWPFKEKEVQKIIEAIEREKSLLILALENNSRKLLQEITKHSKEHQEQLKKLISLVEEDAKTNESHFRELKGKFTAVEATQTDVKEIVDHLCKGQVNREAAEERRAILDWITPIDYASQQHDSISRRQPGTGQWFLDSDAYRVWSSAERQTLFCSGIPGAGKTILTSIAVSDICERYQDDPTSGVAYLYCNFKRYDEQKLDDLLASLLKQLAEGQCSLITIVKDLYEQHDKRRTRPSSEDLYNALESVARSYSKVFVLVDALDECQVINGCLNKFLTEIFKLQKTCGVHLMATSRLIPEITEAFTGSDILEIRASNQDIRTYLDGHMSKLPGFVRRKMEVQEEIQNGIANSVQGVYAQLHLDSLVGKTSPKAIRAALERLPTGLNPYDQAYETAMERIEGQMKDQVDLARQVLLWITCAKRPLVIEELRHAIGVEIGEPELDEENLPQLEDMVLACAGLVTIDEESSIVRLVHYTAQEYFERTQKLWFPDAEITMTKTCLAYLLEFCSNDRNIRLLKPTPQQTFYDYAARNWGHHARQAWTSCQEVMDVLQHNEKIREATQRCIKEPWLLLRSNVAPVWSGLHLAAYFGLVEAGAILLDHVDNADIRCPLRRTPLFYASRNGHLNFVKLLFIECSIDPDSQDCWGQTSIATAIRQGHLEIVQTLVENGANIEQKIEKMALFSRSGEENETAIHIASWKGQDAMVSMLCAAGADANAIRIDKDRGQQVQDTALHIAAERGFAKVVRVLLDHQSNIDKERITQGKSYRTCKKETALFIAASGGQLEIVGLLIQAGAQVNGLSTRIEYEKPLFGASREIKSTEIYTALDGAKSKNHGAVVKLLLENGACTSSEKWEISSLL